MTYSMLFSQKNVCVNIVNLSSQMSTKNSITARELVFTILDRSVSCLFDNTKNLTLLSVIRRNDRHSNFPEIG